MPKITPDTAPKLKLLFMDFISMLFTCLHLGQVIDFLLKIIFRTRLLDKSLSQ